jgi:hypothetical protein
VGFYPHATLAKRCGTSEPHMISGTSATSELSGAAPGAADFGDPELSRLIAAWPDLPAAIRGVMLAILQVATCSQELPRVPESSRIE